MSECTHDCSTCGESCGSRTQPESLLEKPHEQSTIRKVIGISSGKGGVGKSMVTALLAVLAQRQGLKVGILDADITGPSIPKAFGLTAKATGTEDGLFPVRTQTGIDVMSLNLLLENTTDPVVWRGPVIAGAVKQFWTDVIWGDKDILFIDMPPGTGDVMLTVFQSIPVDAVVLVTTPQELVGMIVEKAIKMAGMLNIPTIGIVENMSYVKCPDCSKTIDVFGESHVEALAKTYDIPNFARLPIDPKLSSGIDRGMIELFVGDWLDSMIDAIVDLPARKRG
ncbi:MAG TPA: Mrp/NBP35 family ATP-binding protein [Candidatus Limiplasma sp.]|nr:Mrp/NBP35 family ATP-binding protein [Candidatus Limiplasma sp.]